MQLEENGSVEQLTLRKTSANSSSFGCHSQERTHRREQGLHLLILTMALPKPTWLCVSLPVLLCHHH